MMMTDRQRELAIARQRRYREKNRDKVRADNRAYRAKNKDALQAKSKAWRDANPERAKETHRKSQAKWRANNREHVRQYRRGVTLQQRYGLTPEAYDALFASQAGACAVCRTTTPKRGWATDHCHATGKVRGILCNSCNIILGHAADDPERLRQLATYVERFAATAGQAHGP